MRRSSRTKRNRNNVHPGRNFNGARSSGNGHGGNGQGGGNYDRRARANAQKNLEKYLNLAKDAHADGDIVQAENWYQHADHYQRVINACDEQERLLAPTQRSEAYDPGQQPQEGSEEEQPGYGYAPREDRPRQRYSQQQPNYRRAEDEDGAVPQESQQGGGSQPSQHGRTHGHPHQQRRRRPEGMARERAPEETLNVPFLMNAPQPVIKPLPLAATPAPAPVAAPAAVVSIASAENEAADTAPAPRRRGRPRKNPDGVAASV
jgi:hypothetical protein